MAQISLLWITTDFEPLPIVCPTEESLWYKTEILFQKMVEIINNFVLNFNN